MFEATTISSQESGRLYRMVNTCNLLGMGLPWQQVP